MTARRSFVKAAAGISLAGIAGCSSLPGGSQEQSLRVGNTGGKDDVFGSIYGTIKERVEEASDGNLTIEVFWNSELGTTQEIHQGVSDGSIDMVNGNFAMMEAMGVPNLGAINAPYLYDGVVDAANATDTENSEVMQEFNQSMIENINIRLVNTYIGGPRCISTTTEVLNPDDYNGLKIRVPESALNQAVVEGFGASPQLIDWTETPQSIATGVVDGVEQLVTFLAVPSIVDATDYLIKTEHMFASYGIAINEDSFQNLTESNREVLVNQVNEIRQDHAEDLNSKTEEDYATVEENGVEIIDEEAGLEYDAFVDPAVNNVLNEFPEYESYMDRLGSQ